VLRAADGVTIERTPELVHGIACDEGAFAAWIKQLCPLGPRLTMPDGEDASSVDLRRAVPFQVFLREMRIV
jgi:hypothetical protein